MRNVLRINSGDEIEIINGEGDLYVAKIDKVTKEFVSGDIIEKIHHFKGHDQKITLAQAIGKSDKFEQVLRQATELGVDQIIPMETDFCVKQVNNPAKKMDRWNEILLSSVRQSRSLFTPELLPFTKFDQLKETFSEFDGIIMLHTGAKQSIYDMLPNINDKKNILILIGPEGGFSPKEVESMNDKQLYNLGNLVLRTETAPIVILGIINYLLKRY